VKPSFQVQMALAFAVGIGAGLACNVLAADSVALTFVIANIAHPIGQIFLRLLFMLVVPLILTALTLGIAQMRDLKAVGRLGLKTLAYTLIVSAIAVFIGLAVVSVMRPGLGVEEGARARMMELARARPGVGAAAAPPKSGMELVIAIVPDSPVRAMAERDLIGVMFFAVMLGIALASVRTPAARRFEEALEGLQDVVQWLIGFVIRLAPIGVAALLFTLTATMGFGLLALLARYVAAVLIALAIHQFVVYSLAVRLLGGMSPIRFFRGCGEAMLTAFSTASSNATLPTAMRVAEEKLGIPRHVSRFVLTIGATANQNGTALFEGVTVLFLAQFYGVHLTLAQQALVVGTCILGGIGTAGVPAGSIPVVVMILAMVGIPVEGIGLILGVDRLLDMCRTTLNVTGDLAACVVVGRGEEEALAQA
jgi:Na+/H+-dicarboxylate symporter